MDATDFIEADIMATIANLVGRRPGLLDLGMFGRLDGIQYPYRYWLDPADYNTNYTPGPDNGYTRSSVYLPTLQPLKQRTTKDPPYPPPEPEPSQAEKRAKAKAAKKHLKKQRQKERKRLEKLKKEQTNAEDNKDGTETKGTDKAGPVDSGGAAGPECQSSTYDSDSGDSSGEDAESESEAEELDLSSSFVNNAALIVKRKLELKEPKHRPERKEERKAAPVRPEPAKEPAKEPTKNKAGSPGRKPTAASKDMSPAAVHITPTYENNVKISTEFAMIGNGHASAGRFDMAVKYFTDAIKYNPKEYKLFGNRSFCFEKMQQYDKALTDAQSALSISPRWDKGLYRKGRALVGLKRYEEAAGAFKDVLKLDSSCTEAAQELMRVQITQLMECGFTREQSSNALIIHGTLGKAMEVLSKLNPNHTGTIYKVPLLQQQQPQPPPQVCGSLPTPTVASPGKPRSLPPAFKQDHNPSPNIKPSKQNTLNTVPKASPNPGHKQEPLPLELFPIWVGNVLPSTTSSMLSDLFKSVGRIHSIKLLTGKRCAFVNFTTQEHCDQAIRQFHGVELLGSKLALRYPDRIPSGMGMSRAALKAEDQPEDNSKHRESGNWRK